MPEFPGTPMNSSRCSLSSSPTKVPYEPKRLEDRLDGLGWRVTVTPTSGPFFWGAGTREIAKPS